MFIPPDLLQGPALLAMLRKSLTRVSDPLLGSILAHTTQPSLKMLNKSISRVLTFALLHCLLPCKAKPRPCLLTNYHPSVKVPGLLTCRATQPVIPQGLTLSQLADQHPGQGHQLGPVVPLALKQYQD